eukprot:scaffold1757_cov266-Pinguiococcus_pyrenoidosus.AAC.1
MQIGRPHQAEDPFVTERLAKHSDGVRAGSLKRLDQVPVRADEVDATEKPGGASLPHRGVSVDEPADFLDHHRLEARCVASQILLQE